MVWILEAGFIVVSGKIVDAFIQCVDLFKGMAIRLAFDLALHIDMSSHVLKGVISAADADLRRTVFWAAYIVDQ